MESAVFKFFILIFFLFNLLLPCLSCSSIFRQDPFINNDSLKWIVEIFSLPANSSNLEEAKFQCSGILIHPKVVLTTRSCMPIDTFSRNVTVRAYRWLANQTEDLVQELFVSRSFYERTYDWERFRTNVSLFTALIMEKEFNIGSYINITDSYKIDTSNSSDCIYLDIQAKNPYELTRKQTWTYYEPEKECCDTFGDFSLPTGNETLEYYCRIHPSSFCVSFYPKKCLEIGRLGSPLLCQSVQDSSYIIAGLLIENAWCKYHFAKIADMRKYINDVLDNVTDISLPNGIE